MRFTTLIILLLLTLQGKAFDQQYCDSLAERLPNLKDTVKSEAYYLLGKEYLFHQEDTAYQYISQLLSYSTRIRDSVGIARGNNLLGIFYYVRHIYHKAFEHFTIAARIFDQKNDEVGLAKCYNNMGIILKKERDFKKGVEYYKKALAIHERHKNVVGVIGTLDNIGIVFKEMGQLDSASFYYNNSLKLAHENNQERLKSSIYNNLGTLYKHKQDYDKALDYLLKSIEIKKALGFSKKVINTYTVLGDVYRLQLQVDSAEKYGLIAFEYDDAEIQRDASELLAKTYEQKKDFERSVFYYNRFIYLKDSIYDAEEVSDIQKLEKVFAIEENEKARLKREEAERIALERSQNLQYTIILITIVAAFIMFFAFGLMRVKPVIINPMVVVLLLITFEFVLVFTEPYVDAWADNSPLLKLTANMGLAILLIPLHGVLERVLKKGSEKKLK